MARWSTFEQVKASKYPGAEMDQFGESRLKRGLHQEKAVGMEYATFKETKRRAVIDVSRSSC